jgi:glycosyltransferase involved in cell wall biosynthesis
MSDDDIRAVRRGLTRRRFLQGRRRQAARRHLPVVVVDDGSTDDTAAQAEAAGAIVLVQRPNAGKGAALRAGFRHALEDGATAVVTIDADGQHDPAEIPSFLTAFEATGATPWAERARAELRGECRQPALEHARWLGLLGGCRSARRRQPVRLSADRASADDGPPR